jgi:hypothetical protein
MEKIHEKNRVAAQESEESVLSAVMVMSNDRAKADTLTHSQRCGTVTIFYGSGSGSSSYFWKVMVLVPVPVPTLKSYGSGSGSYF